mmetsp:Transcript_72974/g.237245  ORF Transcript_72974/g.237245 Transcript_72974/m.237245 type:complete len:272 (+) Transcript_72974:106-921(+)
MTSGSSPPGASADGLSSNRASTSCNRRLKPNSIAVSRAEAWQCTHPSTEARPERKSGITRCPKRNSALSATPQQSRMWVWGFEPGRVGLATVRTFSPNMKARCRSGRTLGFGTGGGFAVQHCGQDSRVPKQKKEHEGQLQSPAWACADSASCKPRIDIGWKVSAPWFRAKRPPPSFRSATFGQSAAQSSALSSCRFRRWNSSSADSTLDKTGGIQSFGASAPEASPRPSPFLLDRWSAYLREMKPCSTKTPSRCVRISATCSKVWISSSFA